MTSRSGSFVGCLFGAVCGADVAARIPVCEPFVVNTAVVDSTAPPEAAAGFDRGFAVVWSADQQDGGGWRACARRYDQREVPLTNEVQVSTSSAAGERAIGIDGDGRGLFVSARLESGGGLVV